MVAFSLALWFSAILAKGVCVWRMQATAISKRLPGLFFYFAIAFAIHLAMTPTLFHIGEYRIWYARTEPIMLAAQYAMVVSLFWAVAEFFPKFRIAGTIFLSVVSIVAAAGAYLFRFVGTAPQGWEAAWSGMVLFQRSAGVVLIAGLAAARLLRMFKRVFPFRECARRATDIMLVHGVVFTWGAASVSALGGSARNWGFVLGLVGSIVAASLCAALLTPETADTLTSVNPLPVRDENDEKSAALIREGFFDFLRMIGFSRDRA
jgi:hypothetical protein